MSDALRIGINGFGRIGRLVFRNLIERGFQGEIALNDLATPKQLAYAANFDTIYHRPSYHVDADDKALYLNGSTILVFNCPNPEMIPWDVDIVIEATGLFTTKEALKKHLKGSTKKVLLTGPSKDVPMVVLGVNDEIFQAEQLVSNASCTTNCLAPLLKIVHEKFDIKQALMTTIHAMTGSQSLVDSFRETARDSRAASFNMIPSSTGAALAVGKVYPALSGKVTGMAFRVPVATVSVVDVTIEMHNATSLEAIYTEIEKAANGPMKGIIGLTSEEVVSSDFIKDPRSSIVDKKAGIELNPYFMKLISWYDNEWGYSNRIADLLLSHMNV